MRKEGAVLQDVLPVALAFHNVALGRFDEGDDGVSLWWRYVERA